MQTCTGHLDLNPKSKPHLRDFFRDPPPVESENFRSRDFSLVPLAQGYRCLVAVFLPFDRAIFLFLAHRAGQSCQAKPTFGVPTAKSTVLWSLELSLVLWLQNYERTP